MSLSVRPHHQPASVTRSSRVLHNVVTVPPSDPCLEFLSEEPREAAARDPIFTIEPIPSEPPRHVVELRTQDQQLPRQGPIVSLRFLNPVTALLALYRGVVGAGLALYRGVAGALLAMYGFVVGAILAVYRGVTGAILAVCRGVVAACVALYRGVVGAFVMVYRGVVGAILAVYRGVVATLLATYRFVVGALLALYRGVVEALAALRRRVAGTTLALYAGVVEALFALHRGVVEALVALRRLVMGTVLALYRGAMEALLLLHRRLEETLLLLRTRGAEALLALRRRLVGTILTLQRAAAHAFLALRRGVWGTYAVARSTAGDVSHRTSSVWTTAVEGITAFGLSGVSRVRRVGGELRTRGRAAWSHCATVTMLVRARLTSHISTIERAMLTAGRDVLVLASSLHEWCRGSIRGLVRNAQRLALARPRLGRHISPRQPQGIRMPLWAQKVGQVRAPAMSAMVVAAFTGGTAVGALVMWLLGGQPGLPRAIDAGAAPVPRVVAWEPSPADYSATVYAATLETMPVKPRPTAHSFVAPPMAERPAAMTVVSTPEGARVTVDGIGWGETPLTIRHLLPGLKVVRVTKEGYQSQQRIVSVPGDRRSAEVRVTLAGPPFVAPPMAERPAAMTVVSTPEGARVTVDGIGWGETPLTIRHLPPGQRVVRVTKEGYEGQQRTIRVADDGRSAPVRVTLRADY